ncbi:endonuclease/exonuclease/phosphatase family protein [Persicimonas caeni]|nr:endonuclease/exonuclease/phosphatase family protein [Persicimonas caeni]
MTSLKVWKGLFVVAAIAALAACGDDDGEGNGTQNNGEPQGATATFETYNVGLARGFVPQAEARVQPVADAIAQSPADVMCLQEVWLFQDEQGEWSTGQIDALTSGASESFPYNYFEVTELGESVSCSQEEADPLETCVRANCDGVSNDELSTCALNNCGEELNGLSSPCQECVFGQIGGSIDDILNACTGDGASEFSYNGHNGLLLLSRHELRDTEITSFESTIVQRSALHAVMTVPEFGDVDVYCTHLAANLSDVPYPGDAFSGYEEEQAAQIDALLAWIDETSTTGNVVLMGDMNNGPAKGELDAEFAANYQKFVDAEYASPYIAQDSPECTFCGTNTLVGGDSNKAIDHVFLDFTMPYGLLDVARVYDETVDVGGEQLHLSDHYGVRVTVESQE